MLETSESDDGSFIGRLLVSIAPGFMAEDKAPLYKIQLIARGKPVGSGMSGALQFLDSSHQRLLTALQELISDNVQSEWMNAHER